MSEVLSMADVSSNNGLPSNIKALTAKLQELWNEGSRILGVKSTEGTAYTWSLSHDVCRIWHSFGGVVNHYHFGHPGSNALGKSQADFFWSHTKGDFVHGDTWTFDAETKGESTSEIVGFTDRMIDHWNVKSEHYVYGGAYFFRDNKITMYRGALLWLAAYGSKVPFIPPTFKDWAIWQNEDNHVFAGIGKADHSILKPHVIHLNIVKGDTNFAVERLAKLLKAHGYKGFVVNQSYGIGKRRAVNKFKKAQGWHQDGEVGTRMWAALDKVA